MKKLEKRSSELRVNLLIAEEYFVHAADVFDALPDPLDDCVIQAEARPTLGGHLS